MTSSWNRFESETKRAENPHTFTIRFWWRSGCACASSSSSTELQFGCRRVAFAVHNVHSTSSSPSNGDMIPHPADAFKPARRAAMERRPYHFYGSAGRLAPPLGTKHEAPTGTAAETAVAQECGHPAWGAAISAAHIIAFSRTGHGRHVKVRQRTSPRQCLASATHPRLPRRCSTAPASHSQAANFPLLETKTLFRRAVLRENGCLRRMPHGDQPKYSCHLLLMISTFSSANSCALRSSGTFIPFDSSNWTSSETSNLALPEPDRT